MALIRPFSRVSSYVSHKQDFLVNVFLQIVQVCSPIARTSLLTGQQCFRISDVYQTSLHGAMRTVAGQQPTALPHSIPMFVPSGPDRASLMDRCQQRRKGVVLNYFMPELPPTQEQKTIPGKLAVTSMVAMT